MPRRDSSRYDEDDPFVVRVAGQVNTTLFNILDVFWPILALLALAGPIIGILYWRAGNAFAEYILEVGFVNIGLAVGVVVGIVGGTMALAKVL